MAEIHHLVIFHIALAHIMLGVVYQNAFYIQQNHIFICLAGDFTW
jgi:hypothetical protein